MRWGKGASELAVLAELEVRMYSPYSNERIEQAHEMCHKDGGQYLSSDQRLMLLETELKTSSPLATESLSVVQALAKEDRYLLIDLLAIQGRYQGNSLEFEKNLAYALQPNVLSDWNLENLVPKLAPYNLDAAIKVHEKIQDSDDRLFAWLHIIEAQSTMRLSLPR
jgi:hypothetical protein